MDYLHDRIVRTAQYMIENRATVRDTAVKFGISKSTVHKDMTVRLQRECPGLYGAVRAVLDENKADRHRRGGEATRRKYRILRAEKITNTERR